MRRGGFATALPSTVTWCAPGTMRVPSSRTILPSMRTRPAAMISSHARREATPSWARYWLRRMAPSSAADVIGVLGIGLDRFRFVFDGFAFGAAAGDRTVQRLV